MALTRPALALVCALLLSAVPSPVAAQITVDAPLSLAAAAERIQSADLAPIAAALVRAGLPLPPRVTVTLVPENDLRAAATPDWIVALADGREAITIFPERVGAYPYDSLDTVLRHEIAHLALTNAADERFLPRWFHEGVAVSLESGWGFTARLRLLVATRRGPAIADVTRLFRTDAQPAVGDAYLLAAALVTDLVSRHGANLPGAVARRVATGLDFDRAFEREVGLTPDAAAARAWATYRRWPTWIPALTGPSAIWALIMALSFVVYAVQLRRRILRRRQWADEEFEP